MLRFLHNAPLVVVTMLSAAAPLFAADDHGHADAGEPDVIGMNDPGVFFSTAFWNLVLFIVLLIVLSKVVWPNILKGLNAREEKIRSELTAAEESAAKAKALMAEYEAKVAEAHAESRRLIDEARANAEALGAKLAAETEADNQKAKQRAIAEIESAKQQAVQDLYAKSATLAVAVAEKILQRQIDASDTQKLVDQSLAELDKLNSAG